MTDKERIEIRVWEDIGYSAVIFVYDHYAEMTVHQIECEGEWQGKRVLLYESGSIKEWSSVRHLVPEIDDAKVFFSGSIKWDGCSNWDFFEGDKEGIMQHFCERKQAMNFGELFSRLYDLGRDLIPNADEGAFD